MMGSILGKTMSETMAKQQDKMAENQQAMLERQVQMQKYMMEQQMAMGIARSRDLFHYWGAFYVVALPLAIIGAKKTGKPTPLMPILPLTFVVAYFADMAYGSKLQRCRGMAEEIIHKEPALLNMPRGFPSVDLLDELRLQAKQTSTE